MGASLFPYSPICAGLSGQHIIREKLSFMSRLGAAPTSRRYDFASCSCGGPCYHLMLYFLVGGPGPVIYSHLWWDKAHPDSTGATESTESVPDLLGSGQRKGRPRCGLRSAASGDSLSGPHPTRTELEVLRLVQSSSGGDPEKFRGKSD